MQTNTVWGLLYYTLFSINAHTNKCLGCYCVHPTGWILNRVTVLGIMTPLAQSSLMALASVAVTLGVVYLVLFLTDQDPFQ